MTTPAGWYDDGSGAQRYWDGTAWTSHVVPAAATVPMYAAPPGVAAASHAPYQMADPFAGTFVAAGAPRKSRVGLFVGIGVGVFLFVAAMTIVAIVVFLDQKKSDPQGAFDDLVDAWRAKDCAAEYDLSLASTTGTTAAEYCDGADYSWVDMSQGWEVDVTRVETGDRTAVVYTNETYNDLDSGEKVVEEWSYSFQRVEGTWYYVESEPVE